MGLHRRRGEDKSCSSKQATQLSLWARPAGRPTGPSQPEERRRRRHVGIQSTTGLYQKRAGMVRGAADKKKKKIYSSMVATNRNFELNIKGALDHGLLPPLYLRTCTCTSTNIHSHTKTSAATPLRFERRRGEKKETYPALQLRVGEERRDRTGAGGHGVLRGLLLRLLPVPGPLLPQQPQHLQPPPRTHPPHLPLTTCSEALFANPRLARPAAARRRRPGRRHRLRDPGLQDGEAEPAGGARQGARRRAAGGRLGHAHRLRGPRRLHPRSLRVPRPRQSPRFRAPLPGRGAGSGAWVQVQRQGLHRLLRGGHGVAARRGRGGAPEGDCLQHDRRRFQGLPGEMVRPAGRTRRFIHHTVVPGGAGAQAVGSGQAPGRKDLQ
ncbi:hypothetical protein C2845_PM07G35820 [Panicum miliaceum]|uniref:Uncharacterized protein n=1 Tax=Panicum miliaceum TaxID=4540 RepID=A0A3L6SPT9_PANMI|nr:hypothetical protein C2845_PM07G35820 [Panicum miliaceum]